MNSDIFTYLVFISDLRIIHQERKAEQMKKKWVFMCRNSISDSSKQYKAEDRVFLRKKSFMRETDNHMREVTR